MRDARGRSTAAEYRTLQMRRSVAVLLACGLLPAQTCAHSGAQAQAVPTAAPADTLPLPSGSDAPAATLSARATDRLVRAGFANVAAVVEDGRLVVTFENARYRDERRALREASALLLPEPDDSLGLVLVPTLRVVPILAARYPAPSAPLDSAGAAAASRTPADVSLDLSNVPSKVLSARRASSSFGRIDIVAHPWFEAAFGNYDNPIASRTGIAPEVRVALLPGLSLSAQALFTLQDDLPTGESRVRPGLVTLNHLARLPKNVFVSTTAGAFTPNRYGVDVEARAYVFDGRGWLGGNVASTGQAYFRKEGWERDPPNGRTALVDVGWFVRRWDLTLTGSAGTFLDNARGLRVEVRRGFGELEVGGFGVASNIGRNAGLSIRMPLPGARYAVPVVVRARQAEAFSWSYRYQSFVPTGRSYRAAGVLESVDRSLRRGAFSSCDSQPAQ